MVDFYFDYKNKILKNKLNITDVVKLKEAEKYYFNLGLKNLRESKYFSNEPDYMHDLHNILFNDVYDWAGKYRLIDIERSERALAGLSVEYSPYKKIEENVNKVFLNLKGTKLSDLSMEEKVNHIVDIVTQIWHVHPFRDCNTRTLIAFINQYCISSSLSCETDILSNNLIYFRDSLVAASFEAKDLNIEPNSSYVLKIMNDALKSNYKK